MKSVSIIGIVFFLLLFCGTKAQTTSGSKVSATQVRSSLSQERAYTKGKGNFITSDITNKLSPALSLSEDQQQKMNDALYSYFAAKGPYLGLRKTDLSAYTQQQGILYSQLVTKLTGFLTSDQLNKWDALKPANTAGSNNILVMVYY